MSVVTRGVKNAFRNWLRTVAVVLILAIGIGLSMAMLVANQAVNAKIDDLKTKVGTTLMVNPAGAQGFDGGGEPLKMADIATAKKVPHVSNVTATLNFRLRNQDIQNIDSPFRQNNNAGTTNLQSAIDAGTLGRRNSSGSAAGFSLPVNGIGVTDGHDQNGAGINITKGRAITSDDTANVAVVGTELATKNNLAVGSTFTAYDQTFTVVGIFDQSNKFQNSGLMIPLSVAQKLSNQTDQIDTLAVQIDSVENVDAAQTALKNALGSSRVDVSSTAQNVQQTISSLQSVQQISIVAFVGALVAAAVIIFLVMLMVVRERKREIGVLKAIGGSNRTIVMQFIVESLVLVMLGAIVGFAVSLISSDGIANALVASNVNQNNQLPQETDRGAGRRFLRLENKGLQSTTQLVGQVATSIGWTTIVYGVFAAFAIAVVGSAIPAWLIAKVRPAEVMRGE